GRATARTAPRTKSACRAADRSGTGNTRRWRRARTAARTSASAPARGNRRPRRRWRRQSRRLGYLRSWAAEQSVRAPQHDEQHHRVDDEGAGLRHVIFAGGVGQAEQQRRRERALHRAAATDADDDQKEHEVFDGKARIEAERVDAERAAEPGEAAADGEGDGEDAVDVDADAERDAPVVDRGADHGAKARTFQPVKDRDGDDRAE